MLTAMVVGWKLGGRVEFAPGVVLAVALPFMGVLGAWPLSGLLLSAGLYWFLRGAIQPGALRQHLVLAGRIALTLSAPTVAAGIFEESANQVAASVLAFIGAAVLQQEPTHSCWEGESGSWHRGPRSQRSAVPGWLGY